MRQYLKNYLTWDEDWIKPFESSYSVFRNLAKFNGFRPIPGTLNMLLETRKTDYSEFYDAVPYKGYGDTKALLKFNQLAGTDKETCVPPKADKSADETLIAHKLRGCPECLKYGYHSWMYQHKVIQKCPIHGVELSEDIDPDLWADHFEYLPGMYQLDFTPLENLYQNTFKNIKKIYYQNFFGNVMDDLTIKITTDTALSGESYEKTGPHVAHADMTKFQDNKLSEESIHWLLRLTKALYFVWNVKQSDDGKYITSFDTIRYILETFDPEKTEYNERSLSIAGIEMLIVSTTLVCELLGQYKDQIDCYDYPYLYMSEDVQNDNICSFSNILWNYLRAVKGSLDDTDILDLDMFRKGYNFSLSDHIKTFATIPYCSLPFLGLQKNKIFIDCAEDQFWYQWEQYQKIFKNKDIKSTQYAWTELDPVSYIILQRQDDSFDGYRIIGRKHITKR